MASEIRVDKINSLSGVGTVTLSPTGVDISGITTVQTLKVGTGLTASEDGDVFFTGVCTATTFTGSGANLTNLPAANLTGIAATDNVRTGILEVAGIATFSSDVKIGAAVTIPDKSTPVSAKVTVPSPLRYSILLTLISDAIWVHFPPSFSYLV